MRKAVLGLVALVISSSTALAADFKLTSPTLKEGGTLPLEQVGNSFGCKGGNVSPALSWSGAPEGTKSFVLSLYDPDAPTGSGFWHWVMFNIPAKTSELAAGITADKGAPEGAIQSHADSGYSGFTGACPPPGAPHRYVFTLTALKVDKLPLTAETSGALIGFMTNANALGSAKLTVTYGQ
ncbi:YbhB/YbcL family Raf kinase inhibitor-like protein [Rhizobium sp. C4]|uniref:YbhB/YbcL family Raf kinase inhibitor-like protein n=1 Tax=Rhizobium sp. C4 TaxID=1349800 RepID=UPI001E5BF3E6|nr:YbhB/YbcL family Raf kinase inhibitor-like protein [Rhizobium sp. C4]MCD2171835.1 YbhB/YbcL family Raf kinase inhibitor-like protein [Rhizobium sp. C4]